MVPISPQLIEMRQRLQEFLVNDVISIVESYLAHSDATEALILGADGQPIDSEQNRITIDAIKLALTTATCDRDIIRQIFLNAKENHYKPYLTSLLNELRSQNKSIVLNNVNFSGIDLSGLNLDQASCTGANFSLCNLHATSLVAANLTDAQGLSEATGAITINCMTVLSGTGLALETEGMLAVFGAERFHYVLADGAPERNDQMQLDMGGWKIRVNFSAS